jgi:thiol-disulfide isomerase/thioredoxin
MKRIPVFIGLLVCSALAGAPSAAFSIDSNALAAMEFAAPQDPETQKYLGITKTGSFKVSDIRADIVIVEIFSMYCPYCQADAPNVNELYKLIQKDSALKKKIRIVGIGTGNTPFEVAVFRKKYDVKFPLFPDEEFRVQKISSEPIRTPTFVTLKKQGDRGFAVHDTHIGESKEASSFLKKILDAGPLK